MPGQVGDAKLPEAVHAVGETVHLRAGYRSLCTSINHSSENSSHNFWPHAPWAKMMRNFSSVP